jgi:hypothetical protein
VADGKRSTWVGGVSLTAEGGEMNENINLNTLANVVTAVMSVLIVIKIW